MAATRDPPEEAPTDPAAVVSFLRRELVGVMGENARLREALAVTAAERDQSLERQAATNGILRVLASSPTGLQRVLDSVKQHAVRLCRAADAVVWRVEGERVVSASAFRGQAQTPALLAAAPDVSPTIPPGRAVLGRQVVHIPDIAAVPPGEWSEAWLAHQRAAGTRTFLAVPFLAGGAAVGAVFVWRTERQPFSANEIELLQTFADQAVVAIENARLFAELRARDERRRQELAHASAIQRRLLPASTEGWPGVLEVAVRFRPAVETSGDFYDVLALPAARPGAPEPLQVAVGDVAGKGMAAALVTALARSALRAGAAVPPGMVTPAGVLRTAGRRLHADVGSRHFVACALAVVEPPGRHHAGPRLRLASAAQVPVLLVRDGRAEELEPPGYRLPLGAEDDGDYQDMTVALVPGDAVVFTSDGLIEAPSRPQADAGAHLPPPERAGELFGFERLQRSAAHWAQQADSAEAAAAGIWSDLTAWCGADSEHDDTTLLVLRVPSQAPVR